MYDKVLVPTDGSDHADRGVDYGVELAATNDAELHVLFVVDESVYVTTPAAPRLPMKMTSISCLSA